jgi:hypothetical protein
MHERVANIGEPVSLATVISEPPQYDAQKPVFIVLNSGVMHHVGTCRLSVELCRNLAIAAGILTVRFDFSGIGDSGNRRSTASLEQLAVAETREVMDYIEQQYGARRFVICGLCSGAHNGFKAAVVDPRVVGLVALDHHCYPTWQAYMHFYGRRLVKLKHWKSLAQRALARLGAGGRAQDTADTSDADPRFFEQPLFSPRPSKASLVADLQVLVDRQVRMLFIFTGEQELDFCYPQQYTDCFNTIDFGNLLEVQHFARATHIFTEPLYQRLLLDRASTWAQNQMQGN